jgi:hypothetical protein
MIGGDHVTKQEKLILRKLYELGGTDSKEIREIEFLLLELFERFGRLEKCVDGAAFLIQKYKADHPGKLPAELMQLLSGFKEQEIKRELESGQEGDSS